MPNLELVAQYFALAFSALLPLINPLGSALVFLGLVGDVPAPIVRSLARKVAISTMLFLFVVQLVGTALLAFFGISLPVVQVAGGLVLASMGWSLLNQQDSGTPHDPSHVAAANVKSLEQQIFYPFTFPITAGPGVIVILLTLSAHASVGGVLHDSMAHIGIFLAVVILSLLVFLSYGYAPRITATIAPSTVQGILRVMAFVLLCIGVQITWNGVEAMLKTLLPS